MNTLEHVTTGVPVVTLHKLTPSMLPLFTRWRQENREHFSPSTADWGFHEWEHWYWVKHVPDAASHMFFIWVWRRGADCSAPVPAGLLGFNSASREIHGVLLCKAWRGQGVLEEAFSRLYRDFGPGRVNLVVHQGNERGMRSYERLGFTHHERTPKMNYRMVRDVTTEDCT